MAKYRVKAEVEAIQLRWDTWNDVCVLIGKFDNSIRGMFIDPFGNAHEKYMGADARIGLRYINSAGNETIAVQDDWIIKGTTGRIFHCPAAEFKEKYEPVEDTFSYGVSYGVNANSHRDHIYYNDHEPLT